MSSAASFYQMLSASGLDMIYSALQAYFKRLPRREIGLSAVLAEYGVLRGINRRNAGGREA